MADISAQVIIDEFARYLHSVYKPVDVSMYLAMRAQIFMFVMSHFHDDGGTGLQLLRTAAHLC